MVSFADARLGRSPADREPRARRSARSAACAPATERRWARESRARSRSPGACLPRAARRRRRRSSSSPTAPRPRAAPAAAGGAAREEGEDPGLHRLARHGRRASSKCAATTGSSSASRSRRIRRRCGGSRRRRARASTRRPTASALDAVYEELGSRVGQREEGARGDGGVRGRRRAAAARRRARSRRCCSGGSRESGCSCSCSSSAPQWPAARRRRARRGHGVRRAARLHPASSAHGCRSAARARRTTELSCPGRGQTIGGLDADRRGRLESVPRRARRPGQPGRDDRPRGGLRRAAGARTGGVQAAARLHSCQRRRRTVAHGLRAAALADGRRRPSSRRSGGSRRSVSAAPRPSASRTAAGRGERLLSFSHAIAFRTGALRRPQPSRAFAPPRAAPAGA